MDKQEVIALLGRPLTPIENTNFNSYIEIALENLEYLICSPVEDVTEERAFNTREGYSTAFTDIFWDVTKVEINGTVVSDYSPRQWGKRNASWFNSLVFPNKLTDRQNEIVVTANWGFSPNSGGSSLPVDLQSVVAGLFAQITKRNKFDATIQSKQVEDFRISFNADTDIDDAFYKAYGNIIKKYSMCNIPYVKHGDSKGGCC